MRPAHNNKELLKALAVVGVIGAMFIVVLHNVTGMIG